jgi:hypothetical protein
VLTAGSDVMCADVSGEATPGRVGIASFNGFIHIVICIHAGSVMKSDPFSIAIAFLILMNVLAAYQFGTLMGQFPSPVEVSFGTVHR